MSIVIVALLPVLVGIVVATFLAVLVTATRSSGNEPPGAGGAAAGYVPFGGPDPGPFDGFDGGGAGCYGGACDGGGCGGDGGGC